MGTAISHLHIANAPVCVWLAFVMQISYARRASRILILLQLFSAAASAAATWSFHLLNEPGVRAVVPEAVAADGTTVVGSAIFDNLENAPGLAFRWTESHGMAPLGTVLGGTATGARAVSADGTVVVGDGNSVLGHRVAFRKVGEGPNLPIFDLGSANPEPDAVATAVSADGGIVAGYHRDDTDLVRSFVWLDGDDGGQFIDLGEMLEGTQRSRNRHTNRINAISADGRYVAGWSDSNETTAGHTQAFRYDRLTDTVIGLPFIADSRFRRSAAYAISADGSVIAGTINASPTAIADEIFVWSEGSGMQSTGEPVSSGQVPRVALSADGSTVVSSVGGHASVWTAANGWQPLFTLVAELADWQESIATAVSADGSVISGFGFPQGVEPQSGNQVGWVARRSVVDAPPAPAIRIALDGSGLLLQISSLREGTTYSLMQSDDLSTWNEASQFVAGAEDSFELQLPLPAGSRFFRVRWQP
jgi:uncharacterized membrane protein